MAVETPILLGSESYGSEASGQDTSAELVITLSRSIAANTLALCHVNIMEQGGTVEQPSVSGGGVTWELLQTNAYRTSGTRRATQFLFAAYGAAPSGATITVTPGAPYRVVLAHVVEVPGADPDPVQNETGSLQSNSIVGAQLVTLSDTTNNAVIAFGAYVRSADASRTWTPDATNGLTELDEALQTDADTQVASIHAQYIVGLAATDPPITASLSGGVDSLGMIALELAESGAVEPDPPPEITSVDPNSGSESGGTSITITGTGFQSGATVTIGGNAATSVTVVNATTITCTTPAGSPGAANVVVTNPDSQSDTLVGGFTYTANDAAPTVSITSPAGNIAVSAGTVLYFEGEAIDDNDGDISEGIDWMSSNTDDGVAGSLGTGSYVIVDTTGWEEGARTITAAATDGASNIGTDSFTLTIGAAPEPTDNPYLLARAKAAALGGF